MCVTGNSLGAGNIRLFKRFFKLALFIALSVSLLICLLLITFRYSFAQFVTNEDEVIELIADTLLYQGPLALGHLMQLFLLGAVKAMGKQDQGSIMSFIANYVLGLPTCLLLAFKADMGLAGLAIGIGVG